MINGINSKTLKYIVSTDLTQTHTVRNYSHYQSLTRNYGVEKAKGRIEHIPLYNIYSISDNIT